MSCATSGIIFNLKVEAGFLLGGVYKRWATVYYFLIFLFTTSNIYICILHDRVSSNALLYSSSSKNKIQTNYIKNLNFSMLDVFTNKVGSFNGRHSFNFKDFLFFCSVLIDLIFTIKKMHHFNIFCYKKKCKQYL